jgi:hypothetical protein
MVGRTTRGLIADQKGRTVEDIDRLRFCSAQAEVASLIARTLLGCVINSHCH